MWAKLSLLVHGGFGDYLGLHACYALCIEQILREIL